MHPPQPFPSSFSLVGESCGPWSKAWQVQIGGVHAIQSGDLNPLIVVFYYKMY